MQERRRDQRTERTENAVVVELRYAGEDAPEESRTIFCTTANLSIHGLRLDLDRPFAVGAPVRVTVLFGDPPHHVEHVGHIRWSREAAAGEFNVGIEFMVRDEAAFQAWREFLDVVRAAAPPAGEA